MDRRSLADDPLHSTDARHHAARGHAGGAFPRARATGDLHRRGDDGGGAAVFEASRLTPGRGLDVQSKSTGPKTLAFSVNFVSTLKKFSAE